MYRYVLALAGALVISAPTHAVTLDSATLNGNALDTSFSSASLLALDLTLFNALPTAMSFVVDADDIAAGGIDFNALIREVSGAGLPGLRLTLSGARFGSIGSARGATQSGDLPDVTFGGSATDVIVSAVASASASFTEIYVGNPFYEDTLDDWRIAFDTMHAGDVFSLNVAVVPEPREWMLMLAGLGMIGLSAARRIG
ncbi:MAG: hypothetical protein KKD25_09130 [Gammaproteobacteria bacterium]|nr:hypothetical protein [Gammaproteobacteria bacterium]MBU0772849.1 hypothetical protein [Gammaproteobacteria bacterium]MBU0856583.1 hypothetical protein [Gammaproteobacteria bacterium]MBU1847523.1 hypothetical protein [Gammaproteobacteria bacterium]